MALTLALVHPISLARYQGLAPALGGEGHSERMEELMGYYRGVSEWESRRRRIEEEGHAMQAENANLIALRESMRMGWLHKTLNELLVMGLIEVEYDDEGQTRFRALGPKEPGT